MTMMGDDDDADGDGLENDGADDREGASFFQQRWRALSAPRTFGPNSLRTLRADTAQSAARAGFPALVRGWALRAPAL